MNCVNLIIHLSKVYIYICVCVCVCNFYLNKLFTFLKKIIIIIKTTHIKLIQNMCNLLSKFYWGERESTCDGELKVEMQDKLK